MKLLVHDIVVCFLIIGVSFPSLRSFVYLFACRPSLAVNTNFALRSVVAAAMDILSVIGFSEDAVIDYTGRMETYLVLKRNDPGLLWLAKSSLETSIA